MSFEFASPPRDLSPLSSRTLNTQERWMHLTDLITKVSFPLFTRLPVFKSADTRTSMWILRKGNARGDNVAASEVPRMDSNAQFIRWRERKTRRLTAAQTTASYRRESQVVRRKEEQRDVIRSSNIMSRVDCEWRKMQSRYTRTRRVNGCRWLSLSTDHQKRGRILHPSSCCSKSGRSLQTLHELRKTGGGHRWGQTFALYPNHRLSLFPPPSPFCGVCSCHVKGCLFS